MADARVRADPSGRIRSVRRALDVLELIGGTAGGMTAKAVAQRLDLPVQTVYHVLRTLTESGYVVHLREARVYALGYKVHALNQQLEEQLTVPTGVAAAVRRVHDEADAAAYYTIYRGSDVVVAHVEDSHRRPRVQVLDVGFHEASHATAFGKVMLAAMDPGTRAAHLSTAGMPRLTRATITDPDRLEAHLAEVSRTRVALEVEEFQSCLACMAIPVVDPANRVVGAVAVSLPAGEFRTRTRQLEAVLRTCAHQVSTAVARSAAADHAARALHG